MNSKEIMQEIMEGKYSDELKKLVNDGEGDSVRAENIRKQLKSVRKQKKKDLWGNLATEVGVNELVRVGWRVRGNKMEVYDKKNLGYLFNWLVCDYYSGFCQRICFWYDVFVLFKFVF